MEERGKDGLPAFKYVIVFWTESLTGGVVNVEDDIPLQYCHDLRKGKSIKAFWGSGKDREEFNAIIIGHADSFKAATLKVDPCVQDYNDQVIELKKQAEEMKKTKRVVNSTSKKAVIMIEEEICNSDSIFDTPSSKVEGKNIPDSNINEKSNEEEFWTNQSTPTKMKPTKCREDDIEILSADEVKELDNTKQREENISIDEENTPANPSQIIEKVIRELRDYDGISDQIYKRLQDVRKFLANREYDGIQLRKLIQINDNKVVISLDVANKFMDEGGLLLEDTKSTAFYGTGDEDDSNVCPYKLPKYRSWRFPGGNKKELHPGSKVFIPKKQYDEVVSSGDSSATKLVYYILRVFYAEKDLSKMSACGTKKFPGVPTRIRKAIVGFVQEHAHDEEEEVSEEAINVFINKKCGAVRTKETTPQNKKKRMSVSESKKKRALATEEYSVIKSAKLSPTKTILVLKSPMKSSARSKSSALSLRKAAHSSFTITQEPTKETTVASTSKQTEIDDVSYLEKPETSKCDQPILTPLKTMPVQQTVYGTSGEWYNNNFPYMQQQNFQQPYPNTSMYNNMTNQNMIHYGNNQNFQSLHNTPQFNGQFIRPHQYVSPQFYQGQHQNQVQHNDSSNQPPVPGINQ